MSSHREAPQISKDPVADNTDTYAFVSPDAPDTVTILANYIPLEAPAGGPIFYEFGDDVLYEIHISNSGTAKSDITYQFRFTTTVPNPNVPFYNTGPITSNDSPNFNRKQFYSVTRVDKSGSTVLASNLASPPVNIGPLSTPNYRSLAQMAVHPLPGGQKVFAGQRADAFYLDLGAIFDLADLRPIENLHAGSSLAPAGGINAFSMVNVHTIAIQVPKTMLTSDGSNPTDATSAKSVIGVYASASRQSSRIFNGAGPGQIVNSGMFVQVSRLGMPLFNELLVGLGQKDLYNVTDPSGDSRFAAGVAQPVLATLLPTLYPGVFPNLAKLNSQLMGKPTAMQRTDLLAIFLTGIPSGIIPGFQNNTGTIQADLLRLNMAIPPSDPSPLGLLGNDLAGFPNGRRVFDDVVTVELRALAGVTYALVNKSFTPDAAASKVTDGVTDAGLAFLPNFPYLADPHSGYDTPGTTPNCPPTTTAAAASASGGAAGSGGRIASNGGSQGPIPVGAPQTGGGGAAVFGHPASLAGATTLAAGAATVAAGAAGAVVAQRRRAELRPVGSGPAGNGSGSNGSAGNGSGGNGSTGNGSAGGGS